MNSAVALSAVAVTTRVIASNIPHTAYAEACRAFSDVRVGVEAIRLVSGTEHAYTDPLGTDVAAIDRATQLLARTCLDLAPRLDGLQRSLRDAAAEVAHRGLQSLRALALAHGQSVDQSPTVQESAQ